MTLKELEKQGKGDYLVIDQHYVSDYYERKAKELNCEMLEHLKTKNERLKAELQELKAEGKSLDNINVVAGLYTDPSVR